MYCPVCGAESTQGLNYCTRCGANLTTLAGAATPSRVPLKLILPFLAAVGMVTLTGLAMPMVAIEELSNKGYPPSSWSAILMASSVVTIGIDVLLIWLLLHLIKMSQPSSATAKPQPAGIAERPPAQIAAPPLIIGSVTEHTTRNFESPEDQAPAADRRIHGPRASVTR